MKKKLLELLNETSKDRPLNRYTTALMLGITERTVREYIQEFRQQGIRICSDSSGKGYWIAEGEEDYKRFRAEYVSRAKKIFEVVGRMDASTEGQICLDS